MTLVLLECAQVGSNLALRWDDGEETFLGLEFLRRACPCAACGGEPDVLGRVVRPQVHYNARSFELTRIGRVGGYALQAAWADGHQTGLYSFDYLRRLGRNPDE